MTRSLVGDNKVLHLAPLSSSFIQCRLKSRRSSGPKWRGGQTRPIKPAKDLGSLLLPVDVKPHKDPDGINIGEELAGEVKKGNI